VKYRDDVSHIKKVPWEKPALAGMMNIIQGNGSVFTWMI
jgi:hypothetical protein